MNQRIKAIAAAATRLFLRQGYSKTQISHIAKVVGVSVGTIYLSFSGKREILHFILKCVLDPSFADREFETPITDELFAGLESEINAVFEQTAASFARHLEEDAAGYSFQALVSDTFDLLSRYAVGCLFIEKNQFDFPALAAAYKAYRKRFFDTMIQYVNHFMQNGTVRPLEHPEVSAMLVIEILSWWAMDMRYVSFETYDIPQALAKKVCLDNIMTAYAL